MFLAFLNLVVKICCANQWPDPDPGYQFRSEPGISTRIRTRVTNSDPNLGYQLRSGSGLPIQIRTWDINFDPNPGYQFRSEPGISTRIRTRVTNSYPDLGYQLGSGRIWIGLGKFCL